ncbi:hypothetical protein GMST_07110 [Geomonas silvestris]|uniref:Uncharacterized protein n=1 Tax=Geomonas silvestris TaxID=2740184 RepID=A0A6V8MEG2_9BACT|nr:hypothetical protein [Geomonas silvestris]GFO58386.1 hypothetical protein GMST_07110 [Geomonas silvestris]
MKKSLIVAVALTLGVASFGVAQASGGSCCQNGPCTQQAAQLSGAGVDELTQEVKAKELELRRIYTDDTIDPHQVGKVEGELKELKGQLRGVAQKQGVPPCCLS